jgi:hypothetical protein
MGCYVVNTYMGVGGEKEGWGRGEEEMERGKGGRGREGRKGRREAGREGGRERERERENISTSLGLFLKVPKSYHDCPTHMSSSKLITSKRFHL